MESGLLWERLQRQPIPSAMWGLSEKKAACKPGREPSPDSESAGTLNLDISASRAVEINVCCVSHSVYQSMVFLLWQLEQTETKHYQGIYGTEKWLHLQFLREDVGSESNLQETLNFVGHKLRERGRRLAPLPSITRQHVRNASVGAILICSWERSFQAIKTTSGVHESPNSIINEKGSARRVKESWPAFGSLRGET